MPDTRELFEVVRSKLKIEEVPFATLERLRRKQDRTRKVGVFGLVAAFVALAVILAITARPTDRNSGVATNPTPLPTKTKDGFYAVDAATGEAQLIAKASFSGGSAVSPDGTRIAFSSDETGTRQVYVMNSDGTGRHKITNDAYEAKDPAWSPDGHMLAFVAFGGHVTRNVFVLDLSTGKQHQLTHESLDVKFPDWSPDGDRILYTEGEGGRESQLRTVDVATGKVTTLTTKGEEAAEGSWSPDGTRIVYTLDGVGSGDARTDKFHGIWTMDADGSNRQELIATDDGTFVPVWSPDGSQIAYFHDSASVACCDVYVADAKTGVSRRLLDGGWVSWLDNQTLLVERNSHI